MAPFRVVCQQIWIADGVILVTFGMTVQQIAAALLGIAAGKSSGVVTGMYFLLCEKCGLCAVQEPVRVP